MGNYEQLIDAIEAVIKANGNNEITGQVLQNTLKSIVNTIGANATFAGVATPTTNPGTPDQNEFWIATQPGTYSNFGALVVGDVVTILTNNGSAWKKLEIEDLPTKSLVSKLSNSFVETSNPDVAQAIVALYISEEIYNSAQYGIVLYNIGRSPGNNIVIQVYSLNAQGFADRAIINISGMQSFDWYEAEGDGWRIIVDFRVLEDVSGKYWNIKAPVKKLVTKMPNSPFFINENNLTPDGFSANFWRGKKVACIGSSVSYSQYATKSALLIASEALGFNLLNFSTPGNRIMAYETDGVLSGNSGSSPDAHSFVLTRDEYAAAYAAGLHRYQLDETLRSPWSPNKGNLNYYYSFENVLTDDVADVDLWILEIIPNNTVWDETDLDNFDIDNWKYKDNSLFAEHRLTFYGGLFFLMDKIYTLNPKARIVFLYNSFFRAPEGRIALQKLKEDMHIDYINLWDRLVNNGKTKVNQLYTSETNYHPSDFCQEVMGRMLTGSLLLIA